MSLRVQLPHQHKDKLIIDATAIEGTPELSWCGGMFLLTFDIPSWYIPEELMRVWIERYHGLEVAFTRHIRLYIGDTYMELERDCRAKLYESLIGDQYQWFVAVNIYIINEADAQEINELRELF